jgi:hypothetical protein
VDPGPGGALFQEAVDRYAPVWRSSLFIRQFRDQFPDSTDHFPKLIDMFADPSLVPHDSLGRPNIRSFGGGRGGRGGGDGDVGGGRYNMETYLRERGDANIRTYRDLAEKANFWDDPHFGNRQRSLMRADSARTMAIGNSLQDRFTIQTIVHTVFAQHDLDAVIYPTGNVPAAILTNPDEPSRNDRPAGVWAFINSRGFPAMTVPAGFTTQVYDRVRDTTQPDSTRLTGPVPARLPVGIDFLGLPFGEPMLLRIASAYEARTRHRAPPPGFGPLPQGPSSEPSGRPQPSFASPATPLRLTTTDSPFLLRESLTSLIHGSRGQRYTRPRASLALQTR